MAESVESIISTLKETLIQKHTERKNYILSRGKAKQWIYSILKKLSST